MPPTQPLLNVRHRSILVRFFRPYRCTCTCGLHTRSFEVAIFALNTVTAHLEYDPIPRYAVQAQKQDVPVNEPALLLRESRNLSPRILAHFHHSLRNSFLALLSHLRSTIVTDPEFLPTTSWTFTFYLPKAIEATLA